MEKENIFIDLSKLSEEQRKHIISLLPDEVHVLQYHIDRYSIFLYKDNEDGLWWIDSYISTDDKTELAYPEFIKLFEGGEGEILPDVAYWRNRCLLAEKCLSVSPCDPDITNEQINAHKAYNHFLETFGNKD